MKTKKNWARLVIPNSCIVDGEIYAVIIMSEINLKLFSQR